MNLFKLLEKRVIPLPAPDPRCKVLTLGELIVATDNRERYIQQSITGTFPERVPLSRELNPPN